MKKIILLFHWKKPWTPSITTLALKFEPSSIDCCRRFDNELLPYKRVNSVHLCSSAGPSCFVIVGTIHCYVLCIIIHLCELQTLFAHKWF